MTKSIRKQKRYSISFKQKVVKEVELEGLSIPEAKRRYGITGATTVQSWLHELGKQHLINTVTRVEMKGEQDRLREMEREIQKLKTALADAYLAKDCAEEVIRQADRIYGTDLKKKFGEQVSAGSVKNTR